MKKEGEDRLTIILNYIHNIKSCEKHKDNEPLSILDEYSVIKRTGFYKKNIDKIFDTLNSDQKNTILQIIYIKPISKTLLAKIMKISYPTIHKHIKDLENLKIITFEKGEKIRGQQELLVTKNPNVEIIPLSRDEKIIEKFKEDITSSKKNMKQFEDWLMLEEIPRVKNK